MRAEGRTLLDIATTLGVVEVVGVAVGPRRRLRAAPPSAVGNRRPHPQHLAKLAEIEECNRLGIERIGALSDEAFLAAGAALYAGEGCEDRRQGAVREHRSGDGRVLLRVVAAVLRRSTSRGCGCACTCTRASISTRPRQFWSEVTGVPRSQFRAPYRAKADPTIRRTKHEHGCVYVDYCCSRTHREVMGLVRALLSSGAIPG